MPPTTTPTTKQKVDNFLAARRDQKAKDPRSIDRAQRPRPIITPK